MTKYHIHVVSNTHWDREWYMPHEKYLVRLVALMDRLLHIMEDQKDYIFVCDGQFSMVDDYLSVRPENTDRIKAFVKEGRLEVGPWFTQPLETLVSGEAMVRNLHYGIKGSEALGRAMKFSYEVDEFGHASQTPQILHGFGIEGALAWRGSPAGARSAYEWVSPDGTSIIMLYSNSGYGEATAMPDCMEDYTEVIDGQKIPRQGLQKRVPALVDCRTRKADVDHLVWLNGIDHSFAQPDILPVIQQINELFPELEVRQTTAEDYFESVRSVYQEKGLSMEKVHGELMYTAEQLLESTHACHPRQKQRHYCTERYLERHLEPTAAMAWLGGFDPRGWAQERAWKYVLENHAHDTLGCTSVDEVYEQAMTRYSCARSLAEQVSEDCRRDLMSCMENVPSLTVFNTSAFPASGVFVFELDLPAAYGGADFALEDGEGNRIPVVMLSTRPVSDVRFNPREGHPTVSHAVHLRAMAEIPEVAPFGWHRFKLIPGGTEKFTKNRKAYHFSPAANVMENQHIKCVIQPNGTVDLTDKATGKTYPGQFTFEDTGDVGNVYVHLEPEQSRTVYSSGSAATITQLYDTALGCAYEVRLALPVPETSDGKQRSTHTAEIPLTLTLSLGKDDRHLGATVTVDNRAVNHRLRLLFPTELKEAAFSRGGQPFDVVERAIHEEENIPGLFEQPYPTHPMQDICDVTGSDCGLTVAAEGIYEYECLDNDSRALALSLIRSNDRIDAAWSFKLHEAETLCEMTYRLALFPHGADWRESYGKAITLLTQPVFTLNRAPEESVMTDYQKPTLSLPDAGNAIRLEGEHLMATVIKKAYDRDSLVVRVLNYGTQEAEGKLTLTFPGYRLKAAFETNLDEERRTQLATAEQTVPFCLRASGLMTVELVMEQ